MRRAGSGANLTAHDSARTMRAVSSTLLLALSALSLAPALAQSPPRPPKPYAPVAITRPAASGDASFDTFRAKLAAAAKTRIYAELTPLVVTQGFFWGRDFGQ